MRLAGHVAGMGEKRDAYRLLQGRQVEEPLGRRKRKSVDNIKRDLVVLMWTGLV
jgi:hypothetical protein